MHFLLIFILFLMHFLLIFILFLMHFLIVVCLQVSTLDSLIRGSIDLDLSDSTATLDSLILGSIDLDLRRKLLDCGRGLLHDPTLFLEQGPVGDLATVSTADTSFRFRRGTRMSHEEQCECEQD